MFTVGLDGWCRTGRANIFLRDKDQSTHAAPYFDRMLYQVFADDSPREVAHPGTVLVTGHDLASLLSTRLIVYAPASFAKLRWV